ncbi:MAG: glycosyltransferase [Sporocytophaga sp.]|nr:glycosyltransferase [Sporocytophaga sp.]
MYTPLVSVIIPSYNHSRFLNRRIESVLGQSYSNFEVIILDDCSTDNSREIIQEFVGREKISGVVFNESNSGSPFKQWQKGIAMAKGEIIWIAESDDTADKYFLEKLIPHFVKDNDIGIVYCDSIIERDGVKLSQTFKGLKNNRFNTDRWSEDYYNSGLDEVSKYLLRFCTINNASAVLFRKAFLEEANPFDLNLKYIGDWYVYLKVCASYNIYYCSESLNYYSEHAQNTFSKILKNDAFVEENFKVFDWIYRAGLIEDRNLLNSEFFDKTRHSLVKNMSLEKLKMHGRLSLISPYLWVRLVLFNLYKPLKDRFLKLV